MTKENEAEGPYAVVMAPTRGLAQQTEEEIIKFAHYLFQFVGDRMIDMGFEPQVVDVLDAIPSSNLKL